MKRLPLLRSPLALLVGLAVLHIATAQTSTDPNEGSRLTYDSVLGSYEYSWWGQPGRTYFVQQSDDLSSWQYLPLIESGANDVLSWGFTSTASKFFIRLRYSDIPTSDPFNDDFDGDKVSNWDELRQGTDPLASLDSDLDGLPDDWEKWRFGNLASTANGDPDGDGLSNLEEFQHGTNPNFSDSDLDGLSDGDEVNIHGTDPLKWDSDGDTLPDGWEVQYGLDPLDPTDAAQTAAGGGMTNLQHYQVGSNPNNPPPPPTITAGTPTLDQNADTLLYPADDSQLLIKNGNFSAPTIDTAELWNTFSGITGWTALAGSLIELQKREVNATAAAGQYCELDSHWPPDRDQSLPSDHGIQQTVNLARGHYLLIFDYRGRVAGADSFTVRLQAGTASPVLLAARNGAATTWKRGSVSFEVAGDNPNPTPITLLFDIPDAEAKDSYGAYIDNVILLPVEILVKDPSNPSVKKSTDKLCVATLESAFDGADYHQLAGFMESDLDSFYFRMKNPAKTGAGKMKVRISTDSEGTDYDDAAHEVELIETPANSGDFISPAQILVSNDVDDAQPFTFDGTVINDEALNDRTHKIALGGKLIVEVDPTGGTNYQRMELATVPVEKTVKVKPIVLKAGLFNSPVISNAGVAEEMKTLRETFAQCGIKIVDAAPVQIDEDDIPDFGLTVGISTNSNPASLTTEEQNLFTYIATNNLRGADEITFIYVNYLTQNTFPYPHATAGQAYIEKLALTPKATNANHIIISADDKEKFVASHELLHILLDATHPTGPNDYPTEFAHPRMTWSGGPDNAGFSSRKRVTKHTAGQQAVKTKQSKFAK